MAILGLPGQRPLMARAQNIAANGSDQHQANFAAQHPRAAMRAGIGAVGVPPRPMQQQPLQAPESRSEGMPWGQQQQMMGPQPTLQQGQGQWASKPMTPPPAAGTPPPQAGLWQSAKPLQREQLAGAGMDYLKQQ